MDPFAGIHVSSGSQDQTVDAHPAADAIGGGRRVTSDRAIRKRPGARSLSCPSMGASPMRIANGGSAVGDESGVNEEAAPEVMSPSTGSAVVASGYSPSTISDSALMAGGGNLEIKGDDEVHQARQEPTGRLRINQIQRITEVLIDDLSLIHI